MDNIPKITPAELNSASEQILKKIPVPSDINLIPKQILKNIPKITPAELNFASEQILNKGNEIQTITNISQINSRTIINNIPSSLIPQGADKLSIILNQNRSKIINIFIPIIVNLSTQIGIENLGMPDVKLPEICLPSTELNKILYIRNQLVNRLNNIVKTTDALSKVLTGVTLSIGILTSLLQTIKASRRTANILLSSFPGGTAGTPGEIPASINNLKDTEDETLKKLEKASEASAAASLSLSMLNFTLLKVINILNSIDKYLKKCSPNSPLVPLSSTLLEIEKINKEIQQNNNQEIYDGFILEIVEEPYSPTVNRRKAVAKNKEGIILISTPLSFTTESSVLIDELKLLIDSNNLKAN